MGPAPRAVVLCLLLLSGISAVSAQEIVGTEPSSADGGVKPLDPLEALALDIRTSSLLELAAWCRELGLPENGGKEELARRLRTHYGLAEPEIRAVEPASGRTVVVESAQGTEYFTVEVVKEEYARLRGGVVVSFKDEDATHRIKAREILFNRTRNTLSAAGSVEYEKIGGDTREYFRGESLNIDLDTWTGAFLDGMSEKSRVGDETAYRFSADVIARAPENVTVLSDAKVTTASSTSEYWSLAAKRIWLLPGSEWAVANAVLKVGEVPLLYIPFFYFPGDELVFHPVLGYRTREGSFVQTTTYILGRPKAETSEEQSIMTILGGDENEERRQEGLFLRKTGKRAPPDDGERLSLLMDAYANLGYYLGVNASAATNKTVSKAEASFGLAFSRDVYPLDSTGLYYSPFSDEHPRGNWNTSRFLKVQVPFRYRMTSTGSLAFPTGKLAWNVPFYSDPFIDQDFLDRSENMDWFNLAKQGATTADESEVDVLGSFEMSLTGSFTPDVKRYAPYLESFSVSTIKSSLNVAVRSDSSAEDYSVDRSFFYPTKYTMLSFSAAAKGSLLSFGKPISDSAAGGAKKNKSGAEGGVSIFGEARPPWSQDEPPEGDSEEANDGYPEPPGLSKTFAAGSGPAASTFELKYSMSPSVSSDAVLNTSEWKTAEDVDWNDMSSLLLSAKNTGSLTAKADLPDNTATAALTLGSSAAWQGNAYLNEKASPYDTAAERDAAAERNYASTYLKSTGDFSLVLRPFVYDPVWSGSTLNYALKGNLLATDFDGTADKPHWSFDYGSWTDTYVTTHEASLNLAALVRDLTQTLSVSTAIDPRPSQISAASTVRVWKSTTSASGSVTDLEDGGDYQTLTFTEKVDLGNSRSFSQTVLYEPEEDEFTSLSSAFSYGALTGSFSAKKSVGYGLDEDSGWYVDDPEERLRPQSLALAFKKSSSLRPLWKNRVAFNYNVNSSFSFDFQRYTLSAFTFALSTTFKISKFLDFTATSTSKNSVVFRYFQHLQAFDLPVELPGETNPLTDLMDSFNFFDTEKRKASGFKLKSLTLKATHYLGDWTAELGYETTPYLDQVSRTYKFENEISFLVKWTPIPEFKVETYSDDDGFVLK